MDILEHILNLPLVHLNNLTDEIHDPEDEEIYNLETETVLVKRGGEYFIGHFASDYFTEYPGDLQHKTLREYLQSGKREFDFQELEGQGEWIEFDDLQDIEYFTVLNNSSFLPLAIKEDEGQPQRAMMNFLYQQSELVEMPKVEFLKSMLSVLSNMIEWSKEKD